MTKQSVAIPPIRTSSPCRWSVPKQPADISTRGKIEPMAEEPFRLRKRDWLIIVGTFAVLLFTFMPPGVFE